MNINKAAVESYLRNLAGQIIGAIMIVIQTSGIASPIDFGVSEWLLVANALWASIIPTAIRWLNKKDPAFGVIAEVVSKEVSKKLTTAAKKPVAKKPATKSVPKATGTAKKAPTKKK
jgi:type IV secretory pathway TrbD component